MLEDWQHDGKKLRKIELTNREKQFVLGSILGNGSIIFPKNSNNPHFQMRESIKKGGLWLRCKAEELKRFSRQKAFIQDKDSYRWNSISNDCWNYFHNIFYKNGKKTVSMSVLDMLQDIGISVWFLDKGQILHDSCHIRISRFNKESVDNFIKYFEIIDIPCLVKKYGGSTVLHFENKEMIKLIKLIGPCFPSYLKN